MGILCQIFWALTNVAIQSTILLCSDTVAEGIQVTTEETNKIQPDKGPMGRAGESFFAAEGYQSWCWRWSLSKQLHYKTRKLASMPLWLIKKMLWRCKSTPATWICYTHIWACRTTSFFDDARECCGTWAYEVENPPQWQAVQAELAQQSPLQAPEAPTIMIKPSLRDRILTFLGFGKKQEPVRQ